MADRRRRKPPAAPAEPAPRERSAADEARRAERVATVKEPDRQEFKAGVGKLQEITKTFGGSFSPTWAQVLLVVLTGLAPALVKVLSEDDDETAGEFSGLLLR